MARRRPRRFLVVAYEFADPIFSGNGTYGRTVVEALCLATIKEAHQELEEQDTLCVVVDVVPQLPPNDATHLSELPPAPVVPFCFQSLKPTEAQVSILSVPVSDHRWRCHDLSSDWVAFARGAAARFGSLMRARCRCDADTPPDDGRSIDMVGGGGGGGYYDALLAVDWHGACALQEMLGGWQQLRATAACPAPPRFTYFNFRVFGNPLVMDTPEVHDALKTLMVMESAAVLSSGQTIVLSAADGTMLRENVETILNDEDGWLTDRAASWCTDQSRGHHHTTLVVEAAAFVRAHQHRREERRSYDDVEGVRTAVVFPPVRTEVLALALEAEKNPSQYVAQHLHPDVLRMLNAIPCRTTHGEGGGDGSCMQQCCTRRLLTCCVRQARDKNPQRFVALIEELMHADLLPEDCVPLFFGAAPDAEFSLDLRERLCRACPRAVCITEFVTPQQLVAVFLATRLNVHPSLYDAYGLTIVEAAVCACPSVMHRPLRALQSPIGVVDLLEPEAHHQRSQEGADTEAVRCEPLRAFFVDFSEAAASAENGWSCSDAAQHVAAILRDNAQQQRVATAASSVARAYDTAGCGAILLRHILHTPATY